jgi:hypothetical protein
MTMVYNTQNYWVFGLSIVWYFREYNVSETASVSDTSCSLEYQTMEKSKNPVILWLKSVFKLKK